MKVAIVHDYLTQRGGAERVVLSLARLFPDAHIYTSLYDRDDTYDEFAALDIRTSPLQRLPHRGTAFRSLLPLYPLVFDRLRLRGYDLVISSSSAFAHGVRVVGGVHVCYCYNPPRLLYQTDAYLSAGASPVAAQTTALLPPVLATLRAWDQRAARRPDQYIAISRAVADRIAATYSRRAPVIHPPVEVRRAAQGMATAADPYFLVVSRLLGYKRVDLAIRACERIGARLVVVGRGPQEARLRELAGSNVEFRQDVLDEELTRLIAGCDALIQPGEEDFGLMPLEANAAGRPAVAFAASGALETVIDGITGVLFQHSDADALAAALLRARVARWDEEKLMAHAGSFGEDRFHDEIQAVVRALLRGDTGTTVEGRGTATYGHVAVAGVSVA